MLVWSGHIVYIFLTNVFEFCRILIGCLLKSTNQKSPNYFKKGKDMIGYFSKIENWTNVADFTTLCLILQNEWMNLFLPLVILDLRYFHLFWPCCSCDPATPWSTPGAAALLAHSVPLKSAKISWNHFSQRKIQTKY